jgi:hypothetical protein
LVEIISGDICADRGQPYWRPDGNPGFETLYWAASQWNLPTLADGVYAGAVQGIHIPFKQPQRRQRPRLVTLPTMRLQRGTRVFGDRGFACLPRAGVRYSVSPPGLSKIGNIVAATQELTPFERGDLRRSS